LTGLSKTDFEELFAKEAVLEGLYLLFPTTSFFLISRPKDINHYLLPYDPTIFLLSIAPMKAIGF
jgi:hypothetical protein